MLVHALQVSQDENGAVLGPQAGKHVFDVDGELGVAPGWDFGYLLRSCPVGAAGNAKSLPYRDRACPAEEGSWFSQLAERPEDGDQGLLGRVRALAYLAQVSAALLEKGELAERVEALEAALGPRIEKPTGSKKGGWR